MKKLLGIVVLGLLLSSNAYAGWFSKLPILKCEIIWNGKSYGHKFYNVRDDFVMEGASEAAGSGAIVLKPTKREYTFMQNQDAGDGMEYTVFHTVDRYTGELTAHVSEKWHKSAGTTEKLRKSLSFRETLTGSCEEVK